jgi:hypothetical protein
MAPLKASRTDQSLRHALSGAGRSSRLASSFTRGSTSRARYEVATLVQPGTGHLDFLIAGYDTSGLLESTVAELATANAAMTDDHTATRAGMARAAHHEGFEETAGWFATVARAGRSHAGEMRRGLDNMR